MRTLVTSVLKYAEYKKKPSNPITTPLDPMWQALRAKVHVKAPVKADMVSNIQIACSGPFENKMASIIVRGIELWNRWSASACNKGEKKGPYSKLGTKRGMMPKMLSL